MLIEQLSTTSAPTTSPLANSNRNDDVQQNNNENTRRTLALNRPRPQSHTKSHRHSVCSFQDTNLSELRRGRRIHGLQLPLNPLQAIGWITVLIFALATFLVVIPALKPPLQQPALGLLVGLFVVHVVSHATALLLDPADKELRKKHKSDRIIPEFDRTKHRHVIENGRCHLCNIKTTCPRTKHCSVCNKCVGKFDHHCKWLNHCIGSRNYVSFLMCVVSAVIAALAIVGIVVTELVLYYCNPQSLNLWAEVVVAQHHLGGEESLLAINGSMTSPSSSTLNETDSLLVPETNATISVVGSVVGVEDTLFLVFISVVGVLATVTAALLIHLCFFHIYISFLGLTTYEYIRNQRQQNAAPDQENGQPPANNAREERRPTVPPPTTTTPVTNGSSNQNGIESQTTAAEVDDSRRSSVDKIFLCSSLKKTRLGTGNKYSHPFRHFLENKVSAAENSTEENAVVALQPPPPASSIISSQCVICSLIELDAGQTKSLLCCTKIYNQEQVNIRLGLDVDPEDDVRDVIIAHSSRSTNSGQGNGNAEELIGINPNKSPQRWCSKLYCCATVPDSPDVHLDVCNTLHSLHNRNSIRGSCSQPSDGRVALPRSDSNNIFKISLSEESNKQPPCSRPTSRRGVVGGPGKRYTRLRRFLRLVKFQKNVADGLVPGTTIANEVASGGVLKINQVRPMTIATNPLKSNAAAGNLAPSPRRKMRPRGDLKGYMEYLSSSSSSSNSNHDHVADKPSADSFSPPLNRSSSTSTDPSALRRARKKTFRNHSPKLSPIKESGLSNPASPAPLRNQLFPTIT